MFKNLFNKNKQVMTEVAEVETEVYSTQGDVVEIETQEVEIETQKVEAQKVEAQEVEAQEDLDPDYLFNASEIVGWSSIEEQNILFDALISQYDISNSILDVGCGRADLYGFLQNKYPGEYINYKGIDYNPNILNIATQKYPNVVVETLDVLSLDDKADSDWVVASGLFNLNDKDDLGTYTSNCIDKMYEKCKIGIAFNLNTGKADDDNTMLLSWNASEWLGYLISKYSKVICKADYLQTDVTFFIFK